MASERDVVGESSDAQRTLVDVWEVRLHVEGSLKGVVRPVDTVGAGITTAGSQGLVLVHRPSERGRRRGE
jgi:hypothetical protein